MKGIMNSGITTSEEDYIYKRGYKQGYADGSLSVTTEILKKFKHDAIDEFLELCEKEIEAGRQYDSMYGLSIVRLREIAKELKERQ